MKKFLCSSKLWALSFIPVFTAGIILILEVSNTFQPIQLKAYDALFYLRAKLKIRQPVAPITIVEIDDHTFAEPSFKIPQILWHKYFGEVIKGITDGGARVIGLDYLLPSERFDDFIPDYSRTWLQAFAYAKRKGVRVIAGFIELPDRQIIPHSSYLQLLGSENLGLFNLTTDADDFIRRQRLVFSSQEEGRRVYSFSALIAEAFKGTLSFPAETVYIDYTPSAFPFSRFSFAEIYQKTLAHDTAFLQHQFQGKIVLIGSTDALTGDRHPTPLYYLRDKGNKRTPGVEIVAHTVNTLLRNRFFRETPWLLKVILYFTLALVVGLITIFSAQRLSFIFFPLVIVAYGGISLFFFLRYFILPVVPGVAAMVVSEAGFFTYRYSILDKERRKVRSIFQRFLPSRVVSQLLATKDANFFRGESKRLCILFSDVRRFTTYAESKDPAEVVKRLNDYFEAMAAVIAAEGGVVDKFLGDGLLAFFGAFDDQRNPSMAGVHAAVKMLQELDHLNQRWKEHGDDPFQIGIGLHTGHVKVGIIGSSQKMEYTVIGDAVNVASRLEGKAKELNETMIISEDVFRDTVEEVEAEDRGMEEIRGRASMRIYAVKGLKGGEHA